MIPQFNRDDRKIFDRYLLTLKEKFGENQIADDLTVEYLMEIFLKYNFRGKKFFANIREGNFRCLITDKKIFIPNKAYDETNIINSKKLRIGNADICSLGYWGKPFSKGNVLWVDSSVLKFLNYYGLLAFEEIGKGIKRFKEIEFVNKKFLKDDKLLREVFEILHVNNNISNISYHCDNGTTGIYETRQLEIFDNVDINNPSKETSIKISELKETSGISKVLKNRGVELQEQLEIERYWASEAIEKQFAKAAEEDLRNEFGSNFHEDQL